MAMGITLAENRLDLLGDRLFVEDRGIASAPIAWGPRIGIRVGTERPWRAWVAGIRPCRPSRQRHAASDSKLRAERYADLASACLARRQPVGDRRRLLLLQRDAVVDLLDRLRRACARRPAAGARRRTP